MKILVIGGGGREHAICWRLKNNPKNESREIFCAPGNAGIAQIATCVPIGITDVHALRDFAIQNAIDFTVVGPDDSLAAGVVDVFYESGLKIFGATKAAARLESSKAYGKAFMKKYGVPTAASEVFTDYDTALAYVRSVDDWPCYIKADGLALGKGAVFCGDLAAAEQILYEMMMDKKLGESGATVVIEEFLSGVETTLLAFCDGKTILPMLSSMDYQKVNDNDEGLNTGGMGVLCPSPHYTAEVERLVTERIVIPTQKGISAEGLDFRGIVYFGLMLTKKGPYVIEYNARFGDPETQAILPLLEDDLLSLFMACCNKELAAVKSLRWRTDMKSVCVVLASGGYPVSYGKGFPISGLDNVSDAIVFHAGTAQKEDEVVTAGGRVLGVVALAQTLEAAAESAYQNAAHIHFEDQHMRRDIGRYGVCCEGCK